MINRQQIFQTTDQASDENAGPADVTVGSNGGTLHLTVRDVTGTYSAELDLDPNLLVSTVAQTIAARMSLPSDTAWALRDELTAAFLDEDVAIGHALQSEGRISPALVVTPKAHLG